MYVLTNNKEKLKDFFKMYSKNYFVADTTEVQAFLDTIEQNEVMNLAKALIYEQEG